LADVSADGDARDVDGRVKELMGGTLKTQVSLWLRAGICATLVTFFCARNAVAHNGPPFPILEGQHVGPYTIALWTHPDLGTGTFFVLVDPPPGGTVPKDLKIQIAVQPETGRLPEAVYWAWVEDLKGQAEYKAEAQFDQQEVWKVRLVMSSSIGGGEAISQVVPTPAGYGKWDLLLFALPFLGVGFLWFAVAAKRRRLRKLQLEQTA
jgi:hypothetical protein